MLKRFFLAWLFPVALTVLGVGVALGQDFPTKPIRIIASPPGGANNFVARLVAQGLTDSVGWQVMVDNRPSGGFIQGELLARAAPDGHSLLVAAGSFTIGPLFEKAPYDVVRDFSPVTLVATSPSVLVVHPSMPVKSVKELIALARARPGELNFSTSGTGSANHLPAELFKSMAAVNIVRINYKGAGPALTGLIGGEVHLMFATASSAAPHIKSGRVRALAVTSAQPSALLPGLTTIAASGLPGYDFVSPFGLIAPAKTPQAVINRLNQEIVRVINQPKVRQKFSDTGTEVVGNSPEEYAAVVRSELAKWGKVIKDAGLDSR